jgi:hypothetical protein
MENRNYGWKAKVGIGILLFSLILLPISPAIPKAAEEAATGASAGPGTGSGSEARFLSISGQQKINAE